MSQFLKQLLQFKMQFFNKKEQAEQQKSIHKIKRNQLHCSLVESEKEKRKKTLRCELLIDDLFRNQNRSNNLQQYSHILSLDAGQIKQKLAVMLRNNQFMEILHYLNILQAASQDFYHIVDKDFLQEFVKISENSFNQPEVILTYRILAQFRLDFHEYVLQRHAIVQNIIKEILSLKQGTYQKIYLDVLQYLVKNCPKRYQQVFSEYFDTFSFMMLNQTISFQSSIRLLKYISPYITKRRQFPKQTIQRLLCCYQSQMKNQRSTLMLDCFLIFQKVIFYQKNVDIISNYRLMYILIYAKKFLPEKVVSEYSNIFKMLSIVIEKIAECQQLLDQVSRKNCQKILCQKYWLKIKKSSRNTLISSISIQIVQQIYEILLCKQFSFHYLGLIWSIAKYCSAQILMRDFIKYQFLDFLVQCVSHNDIQIQALALKIILELFTDTTELDKTIEILKTNYSLLTILSEKAIYSRNKSIQKDTELILGIIDYKGGILKDKMSSILYQA